MSPMPPVPPRVKVLAVVFSVSVLEVEEPLVVVVVVVFESPVLL